MFTTTCIRPKYVFSIIWRLALLPSTACHYCGSVMSQTEKQIKTWILPWLSWARDVSITFFTVVFFAQLLDDVVKCYLFSFFVFRPVNFLHSFSYSNRFTIAVTFGATASSCLELFFSLATGGFASFSVSVWLEGEEMLSFIQNISYFKTCLSRSMYSSRPHNICLFLGSSGYHWLLGGSSDFSSSQNLSRVMSQLLGREVTDGAFPWPQTILKQLEEWHVNVFLDQSGETFRAAPTLPLSNPPLFSPALNCQRSWATAPPSVSFFCQ